MAEGSSATDFVTDVAEVKKFGNGFVRADVAEVRNNEQGIRKEKTIPCLASSQFPAWPIPNSLFAQCPMPNAQCPMPNARCPMPHAQCPGTTKLLSW